MNIPLGNKLKKRLHLETALLQDEIVDLVYSFSQPILHGGTAVWRCYGGNRFSEDLDFYLPNEKDFEADFTTKVKERGLQLLKLKTTDNLIFAKVSNGMVEVRFEANFNKKVKNIVKNFEKTNGAFAAVLTLSPDELIVEKMNAYRSRKFIRDIYDVFHLVKYVENAKLLAEVRKFAETIGLPIDEKNLKILIYTGLAPTFGQMVENLRGSR